MRISAFLILYFCLSSLIACRQTTTIAPVLHQAETFMSESPDSALLLLEAIQSPEKQSAEDYATWCLLLTQARDKNYLEHTSDSVINIAIDYFEHTNNHSRYATSLYYKGRVLQSLNERENAIKVYLRALDIAKEGTDYSLLFLITSQIGHLYAYLPLVKQTLSAYQDSYKYAVLDKDSSSIAVAYAYIGRAYGLQEDWSHAISSYQEAIKIAEKIRDKAILRLGLNELASIYVRTRQLELASACLHYVEKMEDIHSDKTRIYLSIGNMYRIWSKYDKAEKYLNKALQADNIYTKRRVYQSFYYLFEEQGKYEKAIEYNNKFWKYTDSISSLKTQEMILDITAKYENEKLLNINSQLRWKQKQRMLFFVILFLIFSGCVYGLVMNFHRVLLEKNRRMLSIKRKLGIYSRELEKGKKLILKNEEKIRYLNDLIKEDKSKQEQLENERKNILLKNEKIKKTNEKLCIKINNLECSLDLKGKDIEKYQTKLKKKEACPNILLRIKQDLSELSNEDWDELFVMVDVMCNCFSKRLREKHPMLTNDDLKFCCLAKLNFSILDIAVLMNIQKSTVSKRKQRIIKHINDPNITNVEKLDDYIAHF
ncbi:hypothetical protein DW103_17635 [Parabacteroides sp. AM08-6]|nr:hypothetical protein DW103_17635 [Parabacteroides sp. AM08-6]